MPAEVASPEILEAFEERFECWNRHDFDAMEEMYAPDAELDVSAVFTDQPPLRGRAQMRPYWEQMWDVWDGVRMDPEEVLDAGSGRYVVTVRLGGRGRRSGAEVAQRFAWLYTVRDDRVIRARLLPDRASALAAARDD
jgi:ketosteroid isomerase-like protein